jgi:hypothetical protein
MTSADLECEPLLTNHEVGVARTVGVAVNGFGAQLQQDPQPNPHQEEQQPARQEHPFTTVIGTNNQQQVADSGPSNTPEIICTTPAGCNNCASPWIKVVFSSARGERIFYMNLMLWNIRVPCVERQISMGWFCTEAPAEGCDKLLDYRNFPLESPESKFCDAAYADALLTEAPSTSRVGCLLYKGVALMLNPDPYCLALCWPIQPHHVPDSTKSPISIIVCLGLLALFPVVLFMGVYCKGFCLPYQANGFDQFGAIDLSAVGVWMTLLLMPLLWIVCVSTLHPTQGCAIKLWKSNRALPPQWHLLPGVFSPIFFLRWCFCALRIAWTSVGILLIILLIVTGEVPSSLKGNPSTSGLLGGDVAGLTLLVGGFIFFGIVGSWLVSLVQCSELALANTRFLIDQIKEVKAMGVDIESIDDATWQIITEQARRLATEQWPLLAEFGWSIGMVILMCILSAALWVPYVLNLWTAGATSGEARTAAIYLAAMLAFPIPCTYFPVKLSTLAGKELISAVHGMRPQGPGTKYDRVSALKDYLAGLNFGQGPGFAIFGTVINSNQLAVAGGLLTTAYPLLLYLIETYS